MLWYKVARVQHLAWYPTPRADKGQIPAAVLPSPLQCPSSSGPCRFSCQGQDAHRELSADGLRDRGHQRQAEAPVAGHDPLLLAQGRQRQAEAVGELAVMEDGPPAGRPPDHVDVKSRAGLEIDQLRRLEITQREAGWTPAVEAQGGRG